MSRLDANAIHARISWPAILAQLGIDAKILASTSKHWPCPACGGKDRFRFTNWQGRGGFICGIGGNGCGHGDGFDLLMRTQGWTFAEARQRVLEAAGLTDEQSKINVKPIQARPATLEVAKPSSRIHKIRRECCPVDSLGDAVSYLRSRALWPLPQWHALRAHPSVEYWSDGQRVGRYPALIADVCDIDGDLVTVHVTYLQSGQKLANLDPRKLLSPLQGRVGCAVRLTSLSGDVLGVAEGIETAASAALIHDLPVWSTINATLLGRFEPPPEVRKLVIFADRDTAGLEGSARLMERLQGKVALELRLPTAPKKDWNDVLMARASELVGEFDGAA